MKINHSILFTAALLVFSCTPTEVPSGNNGNLNGTIQVDGGNGTVSYVPGVLNVKFSDVSSATKAGSGASWQELESMGIISMERIFPDAGPREALHHKAGLDKWYRVRYDESVQGTKAQSDLESLPGVEEVNRVYRIKRFASAPFNDPYFSYQWHLYNDGSKSKYTKGCDINVLPVWKDYTAGSRDVIVAVIDEAIDLTHPDMAAVCLPAGEGGSRSFMNACKDNPFDLSLDKDDEGHGCHVGGTIGAINNNGTGVCGVAGGNDGTGGVRLMSCQIFKGKDSNSDAESAFVWAADNGALIANNSWGYDFSNEKEAVSAMKAFNSGSGFGALRAAIDYFCTYAGCDENGNQNSLMKGGLVVFATGNDGFCAGVPACYEKVLSVGAHGTDNKLEPYSNYGDWVDVCAPGGSNSDDYYRWVLSCYQNAEYGFMAGTSMAAPHASGVAALVLSYYGGPGFTRENLFDRIVLGAKADVLSAGGKETGGRLDAYGAMTWSSSGIQIVTDYQGDFIFKSHESQSIVFNVNGNALGKLAVTFEGAREGISASINGNTVKLNIDCLKMNPGEYETAIYVGKGTTSEVSRKITVKVLANNPPKLIGTISDISMGTDGSVEVDLSKVFTDDDGETLSYSLKGNEEGTVSARVSKSTLFLSAKEYGMTALSVSASDARGASASTQFRALVRRETDAAGNPVLFEIYPNPVSDYLYVRCGAQKEVRVKFTNSNMAVVKDVSGKASDFDPFRIDVKDLPSGRYEVTCTSGNESITQNVVKI